MATVKAPTTTVPEFDIVDRMTKGARVEAERRGLGTVEALVAEMAETLGISRSGLYKWLSGALPKSRYWRVLIDLAAEFHVPVEWLATGEVWEPHDPRRERIAALAEAESLADPMLLTLGAAPSKVAVARRRSADQPRRRTPWPVLSAGHAA
jgi:transcriptional regulator with XRE-family HTH domain